MVLERTNARALEPSMLDAVPDLVTMDVSFISLALLLPAVAAVVRRGGTIVAMVKPQFEAGRGQVGKGGVVRDPALHESVCRRISAWLDTLPGWRVIGVTPSPLLGPKGNREFLIAARHE